MYSLSYRKNIDIKHHALVVDSIFRNQQIVRFEKNKSLNYVIGEDLNRVCPHDMTILRLKMAAILDFDDFLHFVEIN